MSHSNLNLFAIFSVKKSENLNLFGKLFKKWLFNARLMKYSIKSFKGKQ